MTYAVTKTSPRSFRVQSVHARNDGLALKDIEAVMHAPPHDWAPHPVTPSGDMAKIEMEYRDAMDAFQRMKSGEIHHAEFLVHLKNLCAATCCAYRKTSGDKAE